MSGEMQREKQTSQTRVVDLRKVTSCQFYLSPHPPSNGVKNGQNAGALVTQFSWLVRGSHTEHMACSRRAEGQLTRQRGKQPVGNRGAAVCIVYAEVQLPERTEGNKL